MLNIKQGFDQHFIVTMH